MHTPIATDDSAAERNRMKTRIISGFIMAPLLVVLYFGGMALWIAAFVIAQMGVREFSKGWKALDVHVNEGSCLALTTLLFLTYLPSQQMTAPSYLANMVFMTLWLFVAVLAGMVYGWRINERGAYDSLATVTTMVYIPFFTYHMVLIDMTEYRLFIWIVVIAAFGQDICAYFTGYFLGKHKMAPNLSPKKTIEGAVGGLLGSSLLSMAFGMVFMKDSGLSNPALVCFVLGLVGGAAGMAGDLTASMFKRKMGIKDYGNLIPGHGGIMDRFDSIIFVSPVIFYAICAMTGLFNM